MSEDVIRENVKPITHYVSTHFASRFHTSRSIQEIYRMKDELVLINEVLEKIPSKYMAVMVASKRAREINRGIRPLIKTNATKPTTIALSEVAEGDIIPGPAKPEAIMIQEQELFPSPELIMDESDDAEEEESE